MRPILTDRVAWSIGLSVCLSVYLSVALSVTLVSPAKTAAPIELPFGLRTWVGPGNYVLDGVQIPHGKGHFLGETCCRIGCQTGLYNRFDKHGLTTVLNEQSVRSTRLSNRLSNPFNNRFDNRLYRVNGV